jgi:tetratricopeptide (TPR) repeat protein
VGLFWWSPEKQEQKGDALQSAGRFREAAETYARAADKAHKRGKTDLAERLHVKTDGAWRDFALEIAARARAARQAGDHASARTLLDEAIRIAPNDDVRATVHDAAAPWRRGRGRRGEHRTPPPVEPFDEDAEPQVIEAHAIASSLGDDVSQADMDFAREALQVLPAEEADQALALGAEFRKGFLALLEERPYDALDSLARALHDTSNHPLVVEVYAHALVAADLPEGRTALELLLAHFPERANAALSLADIRASEGDWQGAHDVLEAARAPESDPPSDDSRVLLRLAEAKGMLGETENAYAILQRLAEETGEATTDMLAVAARVAHAAGDVTGEELYLQQAIDRQDAPASVHEALADLLLERTQNVREAAMHLAAARRRLDVAPPPFSGVTPFRVRRDRRRLLLKSARVHLALGEIDEAAECAVELEEQQGAATDDLASLRQEIDAARAAHTEGESATETGASFASETQEIGAPLDPRAEAAEEDARARDLSSSLNEEVSPPARDVMFDVGVHIEHETSDRSESPEDSLGHEEPPEFSTPEPPSDDPHDPNASMRERDQAPHHTVPPPDVDSTRAHTPNGG